MAPQPKRQPIPPFPVVKAISALRTFLLKLTRRMFPGNAVLYEQFQSVWLLPCLYAAAKLNVAFYLKEGPLDEQELAAKCAVNPNALGRVMRALESEGIFKKTRDGRHALNSRSKPLLDGQGSLRHTLIHHLGPVNWQVLGELMNTLQTGTESFSRLHGKDLYAYLKDHPEEYGTFDRSMTNLSEMGLAPFLHAYPFRKYKTIADIGGGEGFLLSAILKKYPAASGILFDLPEALAKAPVFLQSHGTHDRIRLEPGSFLESVPVNADLYLLKNILHNWNDEQAARILWNLRKSMPAGAKILILEMIVPEHGGSPAPALLDIQMMVSFRDGRERTLPEFEHVISNAGLTITRVIPTIAPVSLIEAGIQ